MLDEVQSDRFFPVNKAGLFVVAESTDGHSIFYKRTDDAQHENVIVYDCQSEITGVVTRFAMGVVDFFEGIYSRKIEVHGLSKILLKTAVFKPLKTVWEA